MPKLGNTLLSCLGAALGATVGAVALAADGPAGSGQATGTMQHETMQHETMQHGMMQHGMMQNRGAMTDGGMPAPAGLAEPGQGAFAAIGEIVARLMADPGTDWSRVDIDGLRRHLVDMDDLVTRTEVTASDIPGGAAFTVSLTGPGGPAAGRMVPAHAPVLASETGWNSRVEPAAGALVWTVTSGEDEARIRALGFFGLMTLGGHHRRHHLGMATGAMVH